MYRLLRPLFFAFYPETAHKIVLMFLVIIRHIPFAKNIVRAIYCRKTPHLERELFGLKFKNPVGLAGGFDKNAEYYNDMANFGFSFIEIGSISPLPQDGNEKPRLFRIVEDEALINRMGLNNNGVKKAIENLKKNKPETIIAANITKNNTTSLEDAGADYERVFALAYDFVDMFVLNISCPNVSGLGKLQGVEHLAGIIDKVLDMRRYYDEYKPILIKLSPDISKEQLDDIIELSLLSGIDGIVATNTTTSREGLKTPVEQLDSIGNGGLSGAPLFKRSKEMVKYIHQKSKGLIPIIACGGIMTPQQAKEMLDAGASLIEIYTGFIYKGPAMVRNIVNYLEKNA
ncbi:MAG: quinone-dependent dihydroorotate dehydrogenase [Bacteroidetes bacterium]|uniref:Dihydroorotate dehydrogenase (quinone) n=1 Tax=Candidatus Merdivivens pullistercoris TaxID=2840873 RepID=A0A9D9I2W5_9BACT|nr:quinone-dependent dihydroorotate dehydrogenase [Candidatus Merdivivens pullistercoris]